MSREEFEKNMETGYVEFCIKEPTNTSPLLNFNAGANWAYEWCQASLKATSADRNKLDEANILLNEQVIKLEQKLAIATAALEVAVEALERIDEKDYGTTEMTGIAFNALEQIEHIKGVKK